MNSACEFETKSVAVGTGRTILKQLTSSGHSRYLNIEVENVSGATLTGFDVQLMQHSLGTAFTYLADTDFQGPANVGLRFCTVLGPNQIAAGQKAQFILDIGAAYAVIFRAICGSAAVVSIRGTEQEG